MYKNHKKYLSTGLPQLAVLCNCIVHSRLSHYYFRFSSAVEDITVYLPLVMPVLAVRLGTPEITEPSEELRLNYVTFLSSVVDICTAKMAPYLTDMISILQRTLVDPSPEVKKV